MKVITSLALSTFMASSSFLGGAAQAVTTPWTDCAFLRPNQSVKSVDCRLHHTTNGLIQVQWADGVSDTFQKLKAGSLRDSRGGLWKVKQDFYKGRQMMVFESMETKTLFVIPEW